MAGFGDLDDDGVVTLKEVRRYAYHRTQDLVRRMGREQDGECDYSLSISESLPLALGRRPKVTSVAGTEWAGKEALEGFGNLRFRFLKNQQAIMIDAKGTTPGSWAQSGNQVTVTFAKGAVVYTGSIITGMMSGTARGSRGDTWTWFLTPQANTASAPR
jgi:hypothetical protein